jgi:acyl carrier protein
MDVETRLQAAIVKITGLPASAVGHDTELEQLGIDSLAVAEILVELESELDQELPVHVLRQLDRVRTVGDVAVELATALAAPPR